MSRVLVYKLIVRYLNKLFIVISRG